MRSNQAGFTLIELIMVIVILGALAVVALPQYVNLQTQADDAAADGVYGAAEASAAINFAAGVAGANQPAGAAISTGALLLAAMDGTPSGWVAGTTNTAQICRDANGDGDCTAPPDNYIITVATPENAGAKAVLTKNW